MKSILLLLLVPSLVFGQLSSQSRRTLGVQGLSRIASAGDTTEASAPPTYDASSNGADNVANSLTISHTIGSGDNRILVVDLGGNKGDGGFWTASGVTYNGVALTRLDSMSRTDGGQKRIERWYLLNPASGAHNIVISLSASVYIRAGATSWSGVNQSTPFGTVVKAQGYAGSVTVTAEGSSIDVILDALQSMDASSVTPGAGQTERFDNVNSTYGVAGSSKAGDTSVAMSWTGPTDDWILLACALKGI